MEINDELLSDQVEEAATSVENTSCASLVDKNVDSLETIKIDENPPVEINNLNHDEDSNSIDFAKSYVPKKRTGLIDSDSSEYEQNNDECNAGNVETSTENSQVTKFNLSYNEESNSSDVKTVKTKIQNKKFALIDSDSSEDEIPENTQSNNTIVEPPHIVSQNKFSLSESDSSGDEGSKLDKIKPVKIDELNKNTVPEDITSIFKSQKKFAWLDSESSEDESPNLKTAEEEASKHNDIYGSDDDKIRCLPGAKSATYKKSKKPQEKRITGKDILEQRKEIQSESQRMLREKHVSLPYHIPKQRTIKEFFKNRPRFADAMPVKLDKTSACMAIKMSNKHLDIISKNIEKREEKMKEFFKSESEESDIEQENLDGNDQKLDNVNLNKGEGDNPISTNILSELDDNKTEENESSNKENADSEKCIGNAEEIANNKDIIIEGSKVNNEEIEVCNEDNNTATISSQTPDLVKTSEEDLQNINNSNEVPNSELIKAPINLNKSTNSEEEIIFSNIEGNVDLPANTNQIESNKMNKPLNPDIITQTNTSITAKETNNISNNSIEFDIDIGEADDDNCDMPEIETNIEEISNKIPPTENTQLENIETTTPKLSKLALIRQNCGNIIPRLSGGPDDVIVFEDHKADKNIEVTKLMQRYMEHTSKKKPKSQTEMSIVNVISTGEILKETVAVKIQKPLDGEINEKPGVKLKLLRIELENQIAKKRTEMWEKKKINPESETTDQVEKSSKKKLDDEDEDDEEYQPGENDIDEGCGDVNEDEENVESEDEETDLDEDVEENDLNEEEDDEDEENEFAAVVEEDESDFSERRKKKKLTKIRNEEDENVDDEDSVQEEEEANSGDIDEEDSENEECKKSKLVKKRKRIINNDNDEDSEEEHVVSSKTVTKMNNTLPTTESYDSDDNLPAGQHLTKTPIRQKIQTKSDLEFLTPVYHLTGLQGLNSGSKYLHESPGSPAISLSSQTPSKNSFQKALFSDEIPQAGESFSQLIKMCSGTFPSQTQTQTWETAKSTEPPTPTTQEIVELCSGNFTGISSSVDLVENSNTHEEMTSTEQRDESPKTKSVDKIIISDNTADKVYVNLEEHDDNLISQLLNDEEMREFKKKFESPIIGVGEGKAAEDPSLALKIQFDSSDEEEDQDDVLNVKKRKRNIIEDSDEEKQDSSDEEILLNDVDEEDNEENYEVAYDSEENEIYEDASISRPKDKMKVTDFLENEAELSESEWGSEDEDERGLDELECELGDSEKFDQNKVRRDLEKIHMRRILDDDKHEIKILQEIYLEDGELHGAGRQRQFKWKNLDNTNFETNDVKTDAENLIYEELEDEQEWRRKRHERELFLKKHEADIKNSTYEYDITLSKDSQVFKLGQKAIIKDFNSTVTQISPKIKEPLSILNNKRGSFLTRPENELSRLAKQSSVSGTGSKTKNSRNFVFQSVNIENNSLNDKKRKDAPGHTPKAIKKLRISENSLG